MRPSERAVSIQEYYFSTKLAQIREMEANGKSIINLGIGSPDLAPHTEVIDVLKSEIDQPEAFKYQPYSGIEELRKEFIVWYQKEYHLKVDDLFTSIPMLGSKEALHFLALAYLNPGDKALIPNPGYPAYSSAIKLAGGITVPYSLTQKNSWHPDLEELDQLVDEHTKVIFINYPHMPTGTRGDKARLSDLLQFAKDRKVLVCNDNPYSQILARKPFSVFQLEDAFSTCIELNSLSKSASMAGARIGVMSGEKSLLEPIFKIQTSFSSGMFKPLQMAAIRALKRSKEYCKLTNQIYERRRKLVWALLDELNCDYDRAADGMFVWARFKNQKSSYEYSDQLLNQSGVFITPGEIFGTEGNGYIRVSLCVSEQKINTAIDRITLIQKS
ncbi:MAG: pyridoxal phosphate-dependent aminotransferase [Flavobacteriales bacterium]